MDICIFYSSPKLGDLILQLPFIKSIAKQNNSKVSLCINQHVNISTILKKQNYIDNVIENRFRRGKYFFKDVFKLAKDLKKKNFDKAFILEKTKGPALACKFAGIKEIFGFGIGSQKYFVNRSVTLTKDDLRYNYTEQSIRFLRKLNINSNFEDKFLSLDQSEFF